MRARIVVALAFALIGAAVFAGSAAAAIAPTTNAKALAKAIDREGVVTGAQLTELPPQGVPTAVADEELAVFPLAGPDFSILSTGDARAADDADNSESRSHDNGAHNTAAGPGVYDLVTLRVDIAVPANANCLTVDYRFLTEEFDEYVGAQYNDAFLAELDDSSFTLQDDGTVIAPNNFAYGPDGDPTTVNESSTSADQAFGTTYDGATAVLRATTPVTPGDHSIYLSVYDAGDAVYDSSAFVDNLRLRGVPPADCTIGSAGTGDEAKLCQGEEPTVFTANGGAKGTEGDDVILGSKGDDVISGGGGNDTICGRGGLDVITGQAGADSIGGGGDDDDLRGNRGADGITGNRGSDEIRSQRGEDHIVGAAGRDRLFGGAGDDDLFGSRGSDELFGRGGDDGLRGGRGSDDLHGGADEDACAGGRGSDSERGCEG